MKMYVWDLWESSYGIAYYAVLAENEDIARNKVKEYIEQNKFQIVDLNLLNHEPMIYDAGEVLECMYIE